MASPPIDVFCDPPDPSVKPQTFVEACAAINNQLRANFAGPDTYIPYVISSTVPAVEDQDKVWIQTDTSGRPLSQKLFYSGIWRRIYTERIGQVTWFIGDPTTFFDINGAGFPGLDWDGWQICNGLNGSYDLSDRFMIGAHMNQVSGYAMFNTATGQWNTTAEGIPIFQGGHGGVYIPINAVPRTPEPAKFVELWTASGNAPSTGGDLFGVGSSQDYQLLPPDPGNTSPTAIDIVNPYTAACICVFKGY